MITATADVIAEALGAAVQAPSPFNTQPWRFEVDGPQVTLLLDRSRLLQVADPDAREARLSCGAALCNLRIALHARERAAIVYLLPDADRPDVLATVRASGRYLPAAAELELARAIGQRHTNRHPFLERDVPRQARWPLEAAAYAEDTRLEFLDASERYDRLVALIREAERAQEASGAYHAEAKRWLGGPIDRRDGIPTDAVGPPPVPGRALALREFYRPSPLPPRLFERQPLLVAVLTPGAGDRFDLIAGQGMQRVLLTACTLGLSAQFISQPFEVPGIRARLAELFQPPGEVHTLLRIGYGHPVGSTPRRPVDEVTRRIGRMA